MNTVNFSERSVALRALIARKIASLQASGETLKSIARRVGSTSAAICYARDGTSCGVELQLRFADAFWGGSFDAMVADAVGRPTASSPHQESSSDHDADVDSFERYVSGLVAGRNDPYQERALAAKGARVMRSVSDAAIRRVLTYTYPSDAAAQKVSADEWYSKMKDADLDIQSVMAKDRE